MALHTIRLLNSEWQYDDSKPLGQAGGFGEVFIGSGECGPVAIKRLKINAKEAAHRELEIGQRLMRGSFSISSLYLMRGRTLNLIVIF